MTYISIIICTYNRVQLLKDAVDTACNQQFPKDQFEVIIVNNNSTDDTEQLARDYCSRYPNVRYSRENVQGLSHARNRGLQEARGDYVAYVDDDCRLPSTWLQTAWRIIDEHAPAMFGGPSRAFYDREKPAWFKDSYAHRTISDSPRELKEQEYLRGFNMFFEKATLQQMGGFDVTLGMDGDRVAYGEDIAIQMLIRKERPGAVIFFHPDLLVDHLVRLEKMTLGWLARSFFAKGRYVYLICREEGSPLVDRISLFRDAAKVMIALPWDITFRAFRRDRKKYPDVRNYLYEHTSGYLRNLGKLYGQFETSRKLQQKSSNLHLSQNELLKSEEVPK